MPYVLIILFIISTQLETTGLEKSLSSFLIFIREKEFNGKLDLLCSRTCISKEKRKFNLENFSSSFSSFESIFRWRENLLNFFLF